MFVGSLFHRRPLRAGQQFVVHDTIDHALFDHGGGKVVAHKGVAPAPRFVLFVSVIVSVTGTNEKRLPQAVAQQQLVEVVRSRSGEGGIRTPGTREGTPVFETGALNPQASPDKQVTESAIPVLPSGLPELVENDPDLGRIVTVWPSLPEPVKRAILALLEMEK